MSMFRPGIWRAMVCICLAVMAAAGPVWGQAPAAVDGAAYQCLAPAPEPHPWCDPRSGSVDGAADPRLQGNAGPAAAPFYQPVKLDAVVTPNVLVNDRLLCPNGRGLQQNETAIVVYGNMIVAAFNDARGGAGGCPLLHAAVGWGFSLDGGATFTDGGTLPRSTNFNNGDPWLGVSPDGGTFYLSGLWNSFQGFGFYRGRLSADGTGIEWGEPVVISAPPTGAFMDKEAFVVDPNWGYIYLTYTDFRDSRRIKMVRSFDGGDTWETPTLVSAPNMQGSFPVVDPYGIIYVAYNAGNQIRVANSFDFGETFWDVASFPLTTRTVPFMDRSPSFPQMAVDMSSSERFGWAYVVWHGVGPGNTLRPFISHSEDFGATWSDPIPVNTDPIDAPHWWPTVAVDGAGNVNVFYLDRRLNPGTGLTDLFLSQSTDGGQTFTDVRVSDVSGNWQGTRFDSGFTYAGDYIKAVSYGADTYVAWPDARNGDPDIYFARVSTAALGARNR